MAAFISSSSCDLLFDLYFKINSSHLSNNSILLIFEISIYPLQYSIIHYYTKYLNQYL
jgi:hypothetical protein